MAVPNFGGGPISATPQRVEARKRILYLWRQLPGLLAGSILFFVSLAALPSAGADGFAWKPDRFQAGFYLGQRVRVERELPTDLSLREGRSSRTFYQANVVLALDFDWYSLGAVSIVMDSGELSEETIRDGSLENGRSEDAFFREGYFESYFLDSKGVTFKVGQQHFVAGESYILDDFLLAGQLGLNLHKLLDLPLELYASVTRVEGSSLYVQLRAVHPFTAYERLTLSFGWLQDREGFLAQILEDAFSQIPRSREAALSFRSHGELFWAALSAYKYFGKFRLSTVAILNTGRLSLTGTDDQGRSGRVDVTALGYLFDLQLARNVTERLVLEVFYLMASGDDDPWGEISSGGTLHAYLAIVPFVTRLNLFFSGGINENLSTRSLGLAGHTARGFGVPGVSLRYDFLDDVRVVWKGAYLFAVASPREAASGRVYGWETDLMGTWDIGKHVRLSLEADLLLPGSFFERAGRPDPDPAYRLMGGLDLFF